ncbi:hypothetical protein H6P81_008606 [Aristolochia fimbriata]|uniref:BZIP domain-containing protein n=1 Tax=Aristolochia fimbriata TaxID=158543 RepID=A0AAV7EJS8_ARIFI|nr:hypothetical protein H6P81_008606 [Aristolochia fimbriata]
MQPAEVAGIHCLGPMNYQNSHPAHFGAIQSNLPAFHFSRFLGGYPSHHFQVPHGIHEFGSQTTSLSSNSASDDAEEQQMSVIDERKQRRMISNRESARRSRMRKQKHLDELWSQVVRLRTENRHLIDRLNDVSECHERVVQENVKLREEASQLRETLKDMQLDNTYSVLRDLEEVPCNTAHLRAESTNQPIVTSMDLLH